MHASVEHQAPANTGDLAPPARTGERQILVVRFGGTSLGSPGRVRRSARRIRALIDTGFLPIVVVSANGRATDSLLRRIGSVTGGRPSPREQDRALSTGELLSAALMAAALESIGISAVSLGAACAGIEVKGGYGYAVPVRLGTDRIRSVVEAGQVPVIAGFQGILPNGELVTLGRGGSDTTAVFLAAELGAHCHIVTDVDGVYDRDPRLVPSAVRFDRLSHATLATSAAAGAHVVHPEAARIASRRAVPLHIYHHAAALRTPRGTVVDGRQA